MEKQGLQHLLLTPNTMIGKIFLMMTLLSTNLHSQLRNPSHLLVTRQDQLLPFSTYFITHAFCFFLFYVFHFQVSCAYLFPGISLLFATIVLVFPGGIFSHQIFPEQIAFALFQVI